ncbi:hypothetical protein [Mannheimia haemolytica]|uniref:hypothetical protein n=1 Tax=Mannheimia haemolytica TaxID=75985 RepID=UPI00201C19C9|nr:hypothetical protein [Mannheimia haemolytica]UQX70123.1 hypothetical protein M3705_01105 [Mannheimia haemolytica]UQX70253.1 hypothetical protein M3705_01890 [Mannheimia haemolytica]
MKQVMNPINTPTQRFKDGNPATGEYGTIVTAEFLNGVQDSVINTQQELHSVLTEAGIEANDEQVNQVAKAIKKIAGDATRDNFNELANPDGYKHIGRCKSVAELRTIRPTEHGQRILVDAYYEGGTTGGGEFVADLLDLITPDDGGGCFVVEQNGGRWKRLAKTLHLDDFGLRSQDGDVTVGIQAALDCAAKSGTQLEFGFGVTYNISAVDIPDNSHIRTNGAVFRKIVSGSAVAVSIGSNVVIDKLQVLTPGATNDNGIRIKGSNVYIDDIICESESIDAGYGVYIQSQNNTRLTKITINRCSVKNFKSAILGYNITQSNLNNISIERYVTGVYLRDASHCCFNNANIHTTSPSATGGPGNNGLLIESTLSSGSTNNLQFNRWIVCDAGEHCYRVGGTLSANNLWFNHCQAIKPGAANGNVATGACGFKVLGATGIAGQVHQNIFFDHCHVEDVNTNARGQGNFCGFLLSIVKNVHVSNSSVINKDYEHSCWHGISLESAEDVFLTNNNVDNCRQHAIRVVAATYQEYPGWHGIVKNVQVTGGAYSNKSMGSPVIYFVKGGGDAGSISQFVTAGVLIRGGVAAVRIESYYNLVDSFFDFDYVEPEKTDGAPPILGAPVLYNVRSKWFGSYGSSAKDGSVFIDSSTGTLRKRFGNNWVIEKDTNVRRVTLSTAPLDNVDTVVSLRTKYCKIGELVQISGHLAIKPSNTGAISVLVDLPLAANAISWADCAGTWNSPDAKMHGIVSMDLERGKLKLSGSSSTTELRNCAFIASYLLV